MIFTHALALFRNVFGEKVHVLLYFQLESLLYMVSKLLKLDQILAIKEGYFDHVQGRKKSSPGLFESW